MRNLATQICNKSFFVYFADKEADLEGWKEKGMCCIDGRLERKRRPLLDEVSDG